MDAMNIGGQALIKMGRWMLLCVAFACMMGLAVTVDWAWFDDDATPKACMEGGGRWDYPTNRCIPGVRLD